MKKIGTLILAIGLVLGFSSCKTETEEVTLEKIEITAQPSKTEYLVGEEFDTTGLEVTATYSDESTKDVTAEATITGYDKTKAGEQTVTVSYKENDITKTAGFTVTVKEKDVEPEKEPENTPPKVELTKIEVTTQPTRKEYYVGSSALNLTGMVVTATYNNGATADVTKDITTSGFDSSKAVENQTITVSYAGKSATFIIKIVSSQPYSFHDTVTTLPTGTTGSYGTDEATYVEFGDWPQDVVPVDDVAVLELETSKDKVIRGYMEFVQGLDGNYYVKCAENAIESGYKYNKDGSYVGQGGKTTRWFKVMPIKWRVLTENYNSTGNALLLAENELTANVPYYEDWENNRTIGGNTVYPNNYEHSQIRAYLNGLSYQGQSAEQTKWNNKGFLQTAFTSEALAAILTTEVENGGESTTDADKNLYWANGKQADGDTDSGYDDYTCPNTNDKIFLLSEQEVTTIEYGFASYSSYGKGNTRIRFPTDFAKANYAYQSTTDGYGGYWWLRSPLYISSDYARNVNGDGLAGFDYGVYYADDGVVPALSLKLQ